MAKKLNPYINFKDNARQAMEFYRSALGGDLKMTTFGEGGMSQGGADEKLVMHAQLEAADGMTLMASDTPAGMPFNPGNNISISLSGEDEKALRGYWDKLSQGGNIVMPPEPAPWGDTFGMCTDKFGIQWLVNITGAKG